MLCLVLTLLLATHSGSYAQGHTRTGLLASTMAIVQTTVAEEQPAEVTASAATITIKGQVLDDFEEPLVGATVMVKGTRTIITTDATGHYILTLPAGAYTLSFGSAGFYDQEVAARASAANLSVQLEYRPDAFKRIKRR